MKIDKTGIHIEKCTVAEQSNLGPDYICMWDDEGMPIHINKAVVNYLHNIINFPTQKTTDVDSLFV